MPADNGNIPRDNEFDLEAVAQALTEHRSAGCEQLAEFELESELASVREVIKLIEKTRPTDNDTRRLAGQDASDDTIPDDFDGEPSSATATLDEIQRIGRFAIIEQLGQGGHGLVFLAYDTELDRQVALKVPRPESIMTAELRERFLREGKTAGLLNHPNIVPVFEVGRSGAVCYLVSRYVDGITLATWMANQDANTSSHPGTRVPGSPEHRDAACEAETVAAIVAALADAVQHAHSRGVIHRDLKPANVILESVSLGDPSLDANALAACARITDFGLAKTAADNSRLTGTGAIIGTPSYMSPEQAKGTAEAASASTDIYSLGAILYELLTRRPPFGGGTILDTLQQVQRNEPVPPRRLKPKIPSDLEAICLKCLEKQPSERYSTAADLHADLTRFLARQPVLARPIGLQRRLGKWCQRNPIIAALLMTMLVSAIVAMTSLTSLWLRSEHHRSVAEQRGESLAEQVDAKQAALELAQTKSQQLSKSIRELFTVVAANREITTPEAAPLRRRVIEQAEAVYGSLMAESVGDETMALEHARSIYGVGLLFNKLGELDRAKGKIIEAIQIAESLDLATTGSADLHQALGIWWGQLGYIHTSLGDFSASNAALKRSLEYLEASREIASDQSPADTAARVAQARAMALEALNAIQAKNVDQALQYSRQSEFAWRSLQAAFAGDQMDDPSRLQMAHALHRLGQVYEVQGDLKKSESLFSEAIEIYQSLEHLLHKDNVGDWATIASTHHRWGIAVARQDRLDEAREAYGRAISILRQLVSDFPYFATAQEYLNGARYSLAFTEYLSDNFDVAEQLLLDNVQAHKTMAERFSDRAYVSWDRAGDNYGVLSMIQRNRPDANVDRQVAFLRQAVSAYEQSLALKADWREPVAGWARAKTILGRLAIEDDNLSAAEGCISDAVARLEAALAVDDSWMEARFDLVVALQAWSELHAAREEWSAAIEKCRQAIGVNPASPPGELFLNLATYLASDFRWEESYRELEQFVQQRAKRVEEFTNAADAASAIGDLAKGQPQEARFRELACELICFGGDSD